MDAQPVASSNEAPTSGQYQPVSTPENDGCGSQIMEPSRSQSFLTPPLSTSPHEKQTHPSLAAIREASPAPTVSSLSSAPSSTTAGGALPNTPGNTAIAQASSKKRKRLTPAEKEEQKRAKEAREVERATKRAKKAEEDAAKEEDRRMKAEERRTKNEERESKQREKDLKKQQEVEAEAKKQRSQMRLGAFFTKPQTPSRDTSTSNEPLSKDAPAGTPSTTIVQANLESPTKPLVSAQPKPASVLSDYDRYFLPFALPSHTILASQAIQQPEPSYGASQLFDQILQADQIYKTQPNEALALFRQERPRSRGLYQPRMSDIINSLHGSSQNHPVDLTGEDGTTESCGPQDLLNAVNMKHLHFAEDVRPPYSGSYTKITDPWKAAKIRRAPFSRLRIDTDYDYDSEAEWEEPEEGEDVDSEGEEDAESTGSADEMEGFLDDEEAQEASRLRAKVMTSELQPLSTGICWEDTSGHYPASADAPFDITTMKLDWLVEIPGGSINPFSASYWHAPAATSAAEAAAKVDQRPVSKSLNDLMKPPRTPLQPRSNSSNATVIVGAATGQKGPIMAVANPKAAKVAAPKLQGQDLAQFKEAVDGSNLTKNDLLKALKLRFPKITNDTLKETLSTQCARIGPTAAEKRWRFVET